MITFHWRKHLVAGSAVWRLEYHSGKRAIASIERRTTTLWHARHNFVGKQSWAYLKSTRAARRWVEASLARKSWDWERCQIAP